MKLGFLSTHIVCLGSLALALTACSSTEDDSSESTTLPTFGSSANQPAPGVGAAQPSPDTDGPDTDGPGAAPSASPTGSSSSGSEVVGEVPLQGAAGAGQAQGSGAPTGSAGAGGATSASGGAGGAPSVAAGGAAGAPTTVPPPAAGPPVRCDNLALAPNQNGVAQPSGAVGGLKVLDWAGFKGAASFTFDDNTPSQMDNYAQLKATGGRFTWFVVGNFLGSNAAEIARFKATQADGMEVANHTFSHQSAGSLADLMQNQNYINTNFGVNANSMAAPNCAAAWATVAPNLLFQNRGPCGAPINTIRAGAADNTSPFAIPAYLPAANEAAATMSGALVDGQWRVYVIHGFDNRNGTFQPIPIANVTGAISTAVSRGYWVEGMSNIGAYWQGQKLISAAATTSATWTKPARFPANMCLRITTTGGTVTQKGQVIPWDPHGYYQIGLDAGEVTIQ